MAQSEETRQNIADSSAARSCASRSGRLTREIQESHHHVERTPEEAAKLEERLARLERQWQDEDRPPVTLPVTHLDKER